MNHSKRLHLLTLKYLKLQGDYALVASGLNSGDKVVSAAVGQMREGLKVREYKATY